MQIIANTSRPSDALASSKATPTDTTRSWLLSMMKRKKYSRSNTSLTSLTDESTCDEGDTFSPIQEQQLVEEAAPAIQEDQCAIEEDRDTSFQADSLLKDICAALAIYTDKEAELNDKIARHMERAKARLESSNSVGALLSMRQVKRLQAKHARLVDVIQFLGGLEVKLVMQMMGNFGMMNRSSNVFKGKQGNKSAQPAVTIDDMADHLDDMLSSLDDEEVSRTTVDEDDETLLNELKELLAQSSA